MEIIVKPLKQNITQQVNTLPNGKINPESSNRRYFELSTTDFDDFMEIKQIRNEKNQQQSVMFFFIGLCIALGLVIIAFNWKFFDDGAILSLSGNAASNFEEIQDIPTTQQPPPPPVKILRQPKIVVVPDEELIEEVEVDLDVEISEEMAVAEIEFDAPEPEEEKAEEIFHIVETAPAPPGGYQGFYKYVGSELKYPSLAKRQGIQGRVFIRFVVSKTGEISNVELIKGIGGGCDEEAVRVIENAPRWSPGKQRGKPVNVYMTLPITFVLKKAGRS